uniref:Uncharacterized protein n=1 Tax=Rhizophora mucronata TaxID=61149 RepID=A0A2P2KX32_RHIMU
MGKKILFFFFFNGKAQGLSRKISPPTIQFHQQHPFICTKVG